MTVISIGSSRQRQNYPVRNVESTSNLVSPDPFPQRLLGQGVVELDCLRVVDVDVDEAASADQNIAI